MDNETLRQQYNKIYRYEPNKWTDELGDNDAWFMLNRLMSKPPYNVLDIGCGNGHTIKYFSERWKTTQFTGIDISYEALKLAKKVVPNAIFLLGELEEVDIKEEFEIITLLGVAEHFDDIERKLKYIRQFLHPRGMLYLQVPNCLEYSEIKEEGFRPSIGGNQMEWHLKKETWNGLIINAGYAIYITRTNSRYPVRGFMWILQIDQTSR